MSGYSKNRPSHKRTIMSDTPLLSLQDLQISLPPTERDFSAVDGISLAINRGEILGLAGESGSGKGLIALAVTHLIPPPGQISGGQVIFDGFNVASLTPADLLKLRGGRIGMIFQDPMSSLNPTFTVGDQISKAYRLHISATPVGGPYPHHRIYGPDRHSGPPPPLRQLPAPVIRRNASTGDDRHGTDLRA